MDETRDIGWKQFSISVLDLLRWPIAFVVAILILRVSIEHLFDAVATALHG